jgi:hypothetical protein
MTGRWTVFLAGTASSAVIGVVAGTARAQAVSADRPVVVRAEDSSGTNRRAPARRLLREGTFLSDRQGWLRPVGAERWAMLFDGVTDPDTGSTVIDPPMAVLPCLKLMEMRRIVEARPETVTFRVSGRVLVYKGRNYLLPTFFMTLADAGHAGGGSGEGKGELTDEARAEARRAFDDLMGRGGNGAGDAGSGGANDPDAILKDVDKATPNVTIPVAPSGTSGRGSDGQKVAMPRTAAGGSGGGGGAGGVSGGEDGAWKLVREGTMLTARRGRLLRGAMGEFIFAPDNGTGMAPPTKPDAKRGTKADEKGATAKEAATQALAANDPASMALGPMRLIPCLNLQEMERLTQTHAVPLEFKISGQVFVYDGKNYLLPTMYLIEADRDGNVTSGQ